MATFPDLYAGRAVGAPPPQAEMARLKQQLAQAQGMLQLYAKRDDMVAQYNQMAGDSLESPRRTSSRRSKHQQQQQFGMPSGGFTPSPPPAGSRSARSRRGADMDNGYSNGHANGYANGHGNGSVSARSAPRSRGLRPPQPQNAWTAAPKAAHAQPAAASRQMMMREQPPPQDSYAAYEDESDETESSTAIVPARPQTAAGYAPAAPAPARGMAVASPQRIAALDYQAATLRRKLDDAEKEVERLMDENEALRNQLDGRPDSNGVASPMRGAGAAAATTPSAGAGAGLASSLSMSMSGRSGSGGLADGGTDPVTGQKQVVLKVPKGLATSKGMSLSQLLQLLAYNGLYSDKSGGKNGGGGRGGGDDDDDDDDDDIGVDDDELKDFIETTYTEHKEVEQSKPKGKGMWRIALRAISAYAETERKNFTLEQMNTPEMQEALTGIDTWGWNVFGVAALTADKPVVVAGFRMFELHGLLPKFRINPEKLHAFLSAINDGYLASNPYHNSIHAVDVAQSLHHFLTEGGLGVHMTNRDILAGIVAAIVHDFEHPGKGNPFLVATKHPKAVLYNDKSVLENHHVAAAYKLLNQDKYNIFENLSPEEYREVRATIIEMVLHTDMAGHMANLKHFTAKTSEGPLDYTSIDNRRLMLDTALHCADVANPARQTKTATKWAFRVMEEFYRQGDEERNNGMPISMFYDRTKPEVGKCQSGFLQFIIEPLYKAFAPNLKDKGKEILGNIERNREYWLAYKEREEAGNAYHEDTFAPATDAVIKSTPAVGKALAAMAANASGKANGAAEANGNGTHRKRRRRRHRSKATGEGGEK